MNYKNRARGFLQIPAGQITFWILAIGALLIFVWGYVG